MEKNWDYQKQIDKVNKYWFAKQILNIYLPLVLLVALIHIYHVQWSDSRLYTIIQSVAYFLWVIGTTLMLFFLWDLRRKKKQLSIACEWHDHSAYCILASFRNLGILRQAVRRFLSACEKKQIDDLLVSPEYERLGQAVELIAYANSLLTNDFGPSVSSDSITSIEKVINTEIDGIVEDTKKVLPGMKRLISVVIADNGEEVKVILVVDKEVSDFLYNNKNKKQV